MTILLDTHILLWWLSADDLLPKKARDIISSPNNLIFISSISAWEIVLKKSLGKLKCPDDLDRAIHDSQFEVLLFTLEHAMALQKLPSIHDDPFDRALIAQAKIESFTFMTKDKKIIKYPINCVEL
ncbi:MAG: type II toxin-antitoxin system VapC family toxin [Deltaproteobacteria bacterium]|nr:type II toxin-antitoxin system VapC family toxin [Deltaproteobacteria bacterium]